MMRFDLIVIGAGPGGYTAAIRAAQLKMSVACIDNNDALGGTCLRIGCIPSKALLESSERYIEARDRLAEYGVEVDNVRLDLARMQKRKAQIVDILTKGIASLFKKHEITRIAGHARFSGGRRLVVETNDGTRELEAEHILIATGSKPATLPGIELDGEFVGTSTEALTYADVPEHLVVIGAGYIGLEMGTVWQRLGSTVTILEYLDRILPGTDGEVAEQALKIFQKQGLTFRLSSRVTSARREKDACVVECADAEPIRCDRVLVAVGRKPNVDRLDLKAVGIETSEKGFIKVNERFATSADRIYAVGDVIGGALLAHKAEEEGIACVEGIATGYAHVDYQAIPSVVYTHPEIAAVGMTQEELESKGVNFRVGSFPFRANARARTLGDVAGFVKILADAETDRLRGVHIIGPRAGDLIAEAAVAIAFGGSAEDLARCSHAHPTLAEAVREAALAVDNRPLNF